MLLLSGITLLLAQEWEYVARVASDASTDETSVLLEIFQPIQPGRLIMIESRDGTVRQTYEVRHVYDHHIILETRLTRDFVAGSKVYQ